MKRPSYYYLFYLAGFFLIFWIWPLGTIFGTSGYFIFLTILFLPTAAVIHFTRLPQDEKRRLARQYLLGYGITYCGPMSLGLIQLIIEILLAGFFHNRNLFFADGIVSILVSWLFCGLSDYSFKRLGDWLATNKIPIESSELSFSKGFSRFCILLVGALQYLKCAPDFSIILDHNLAEKATWIFVGIAALFYPEADRDRSDYSWNKKLIIGTSIFSLLALALPDLDLERVMLICAIFPVARTLHTKLDLFGKRVVESLAFLYTLNIIILWVPFDHEIDSSDVLSIATGLLGSLFYVGAVIGKNPNRPHFLGETFSAGFFLGTMAMLPSIVMGTSLKVTYLLSSYIEDTVIAHGGNSFSAHEIGIIQSMGESYGLLGVETFLIGTISGLILTTIETLRSKNNIAETASNSNTADLLWCMIFTGSTVWITSSTVMSKVVHEMAELQLIGIAGVEFPAITLRDLYCDVPLAFYLISMARLCIRRLTLGRFRLIDGIIIGYNVLMGFYVLGNPLLVWYMFFAPLFLALTYMFCIRFRDIKSPDSKRNIIDLAWGPFLSRFITVALFLAVYQTMLAITVVQAKAHLDRNLSFDDNALLRMRVASQSADALGVAQPGTFDGAGLESQVQFFNKTFVIVPWTTLAGWLLYALLVGWIGGTIIRELLYLGGFNGTAVKRPTAQADEKTAVAAAA